MMIPSTYLLPAHATAMLLEQPAGFVRLLLVGVACGLYLTVLGV